MESRGTKTLMFKANLKFFYASLDSDPLYKNPITPLEGLDAAPAPKDYCKKIRKLKDFSGTKYYLLNTSSHYIVYFRLKVKTREQYSTINRIEVVLTLNSIQILLLLPLRHYLPPPRHSPPPSHRSPPHPSSFLFLSPGKTKNILFLKKSLMLSIQFLEKNVSPVPRKLCVKKSSFVNASVE